MRKLLNNKPAAIVAILVGPLLLCCLCCVGTIFVGTLLPTEIKLTSSPTSSWNANEPSQTVKFDCTNAQKIELNGAVLSEKDKNDLCLGSGYKVNLQDGENIFTFIASHERGDTSTVELKISFDKKAYEDRIAAEEKKRQEDELKAQQEKAAVEEDKKRREAEEKARADEEAKRLKEGDVLAGPSIADIWAKHDEQKALSDVKAKNYLDSLVNTKVIWVGTVNNVDTKTFTDGYYVTVDMGGGLFDSKSFTIDDSRKQFGNLNKGQLVKVTGQIKSADGLFGGVSIFIKNATVEVVE